MNKIIGGDSLEELKKLPNESADCIVTSPPYYGLRDYGVKGQIGLEATFQEYIRRLCDIFDEVKRVLKKTGTCWVNMGDTYNGNKNKNHLPDKCLLQVPSRFAIEMCNRGWILRNEIIWWKPNCMPSSIKDRFTVDFEKVFLFVKSKRYWFETQLEPAKYDGRKETLMKGSEKYQRSILPDQSEQALAARAHERWQRNDRGQYLRNKRTVWRVPTKPYKEAHFATYPPALIEPMLRAGCPEFVCKKCDAPREKIFRYLNKPTRTGRGSEQLKKDRANGLLASQGGTSSSRPDCSVYPTPKELAGYTDCGCNAGFESGIVLDPFIGSGTTAVVARQLNRNFVGIEINSEYITMAERRLGI